MQLKKHFNRILNKRASQSKLYSERKLCTMQICNESQKVDGSK